MLATGGKKQPRTVIVYIKRYSTRFGSVKRQSSLVCILMNWDKMDLSLFCKHWASQLGAAAVAPATRQHSYQCATSLCAPIFSPVRNRVVLRTLAMLRSYSILGRMRREGEDTSSCTRALANI